MRVWKKVRHVLTSHLVSSRIFAYSQLIKRIVLTISYYFNRIIKTIKHSIVYSLSLNCINWFHQTTAHKKLPHWNWGSYEKVLKVSGKSCALGWSEKQTLLSLCSIVISIGRSVNKKWKKNLIVFGFYH